MLNQKKIVSSFIIFGSLFFSFTACMKATLAPYEQQKKAVESLEKAKAVKAEAYAEKEYLEATTLSEEGNKLIVDKEKSTKNTKAKNKYDLSIKQSVEAYHHALGFYTKDLIDEGTQEMQNLQDQHVNLELKDDFEKTKALLNQASSLHKEGQDEDEKRQGEKRPYTPVDDTFVKGDTHKKKGKYEQSHEVLKTFKESLRQLKEAFAELLERGNAFLVEIQALLNQAKAYKADVAFPSEYELANEGFRQLQDLVKERSYKQANEKGASVKNEIELLLEKTKEKAILAQKAYQQAKNLFKKATEINVDVKEDIDEKNDQSVKEYYETFKNKK